MHILYIVGIIIAIILSVTLVVYLCIKNKKINILEKTKFNTVKVHSMPKTDMVMHNSIKGVYLFNPSIAINPKNSTEIIVLSRVAGESLIPEKKWCELHKKYFINDFSNIKNIKNYFKLFGKKKKESSGIVIYSTNRDYSEMVNPEIINPFLNENNISFKNYALGFEDPRIFKFRGELWCICYFRGKNFPYKSKVNTDRFGHHIIIFPLDNPSLTTILEYSQRTYPIEKNWMPFEYNNDLYIVYSIKPHKILKVNIFTGKCREVFSTKLPKKSFLSNQIGNGAPPQKININGKESYLGLAHTKKYRVRKNFIYMFETSPPFKITHISNPFDIIDKHVYIEFGSGLLVDNNSKIVTISFGMGDCFNSFKNFTFTEIEKMLINV